MKENAIEITGLKKSFGSNIIFDNFDMSIKKNEFVAITGSSGKGKSTLLNIIGLLETKDEGTVIINGIENAALNKKNGIQLLRNSIGYLFQNYALIDNETVMYNLNIALKFEKNVEKNDLIISALETVGLSKNDLNKKIFKMSGGEQQRVALARLILKPCEIILADEPTGSLDAKNRDMVLDVLKSLQTTGKTILIVTHDSYVSNFCDRIIEL